MPDIIIKDEFGEDEVYEGVNTVRFRTPEGHLAQFSTPGYDVDSIIDGSVMTISTNAESVMAYGLEARTNLVSFYGPKVKTVNSYAFYNCPTLQELYLPSVEIVAGNMGSCPALVDVTLGETVFQYPFNKPQNAITVPATTVANWRLSNTETPFKHSGDTNLQRYAAARRGDASAALAVDIYAEAGETLVAVVAYKTSLANFDGWTVMHSFEAVTDSSTTLILVAYQEVTETGNKSFVIESTNPNAGDEFIVLAFKNVQSIIHPEGFFAKDTSGLGQYFTLPVKQAGQKILRIACTISAYANTGWFIEPSDLTVVQSESSQYRRLGVFVDFGEPKARQAKHGEKVYTTDSGVTYDAVEIDFYEGD